LTVLGTRFAMMINGIVIIEAVYNWPGVGNLAIQSLRSRDYPLIQANVLITSILAVMINLAVDLSYYFIDPRVRRQTSR
jgi:peptide/nickel transport system permease protein